MELGYPLKLKEFYINPPKGKSPAQIHAKTIEFSITPAPILPVNLYIPQLIPVEKMNIGTIAQINSMKNPANPGIRRFPVTNIIPY